MKLMTVRDGVRGSCKRVILLGIISFAFALSGCSDKPSERDARKVFENLYAHDGGARVKSFKKVNATTSSMFGQEVYTVQFTATIEHLQDSSGGMFSRARKTGEIETMDDGQLMFIKTEKGWQGKDGKIY